MAEDCALPCSFQPSSNETVRWFRQDVVVYTLEGGDSGKEHTGHEHLSVYPPLVSHGNATLIIRRSGLKDRGTYRCHVTTSEREHSAKVIVKVEGE